MSACTQSPRGAGVTAPGIAVITALSSRAMGASAPTVEQFLASLPTDRRAALAAVRDTINSRLPAGYEETMQYGMISWIVPASRLAATYNGQPLALASLGSQKQHMALYLMSVYGDQRLGSWFRDAYRAAGKKLDMGKACVRFKTLDALPLDVIGEVIARVSVDAYVAVYEASRSQAVKPVPIAERGAPPASAGKQATRRTAARRAGTATKRAVPTKAGPAPRKPARSASKRRG